jgi:ABC-type nitrate/sulfonate/bicarbonate transport system ATPase subunit
MTPFMREQLQRVLVETATTTVLVSHDLEEAVYLSDRILLLSRHPARARRAFWRQNRATNQRVNASVGP